MMDYYCQHSLLAANLQQDVVQNHAESVEIPVLRAVSDAAGQQYQILSALVTPYVFTVFSPTYLTALFTHNFFSTTLIVLLNSSKAGPSALWNVMMCCIPPTEKKPVCPHKPGREGRQHEERNLSP